VSDLEPCPFCGGDGILRSSSGYSRHMRKHVNSNWVDCTNYPLKCGGSTRHVSSAEEAIELWNNRLIEEALQAENERMRELLSLCLPHVEASCEASHLTDGFKPKRNYYDEFLETLKDALKDKK